MPIKKEEVSNCVSLSLPVGRQVWQGPTQFVCHIEFGDLRQAQADRLIVMLSPATFNKLRLTV
jgi:hypothetical protein